MTTKEQTFLRALLAFEIAAQELYTALLAVDDHTGERFSKDYPFDCCFGDLAMSNIPEWRKSVENQFTPWEAEQAIGGGRPLTENKYADRATATANSSHGIIDFDAFTGEVLNIDLDDEWKPEDYPTKFDVVEYYLKYGRIVEEVDILDIGYWMKDNRYEAPSEDWRTDRDERVKENSEWTQAQGRVDRKVSKVNAEPQTGMIDGVFSIDGNGGDSMQYKGKYNPNTRWNGWYVPYFDQETAEKVINDIMHYVGFDFTDNIFTITPQEGDVEEFTPTIIDGKLMWCIGGYDWCWWTNPNVPVFNTEYIEDILSRKRNGIDPTEEETTEIKDYLRELKSHNEQPLVAEIQSLFPIEYGEYLDEDIIDQGAPLTNEIKCPHCLSHNVKSIDNQPLAHGDQLHGMGQYDTEMYLEFECYDCEKRFNETLDIVRRKSYIALEAANVQAKDAPPQFPNTTPL